MSYSSKHQYPGRLLRPNMGVFLRQPVLPVKPQGHINLHTAGGQQAEPCCKAAVWGGVRCMLAHDEGGALGFMRRKRQTSFSSCQILTCLGVFVL